MGNGTPIAGVEPESEVGVGLAVEGEGDPQVRFIDFLDFFLLFHVEHLAIFNFFTKQIQIRSDPPPFLCVESRKIPRKFLHG